MAGLCGAAALRAEAFFFGFFLGPAADRALDEERAAGGGAPFRAVLSFLFVFDLAPLVVLDEAGASTIPPGPA